MKARFILAALASTLLFVGTGCGSACDDLQECCEAIAPEGTTCDYSEADEDACEDAKDAVKSLAGDDLPEECDF